MLKREVNILSDSNVRKKKAAMNCILEKMNNGELNRGRIMNTLGKKIFKLFNDPSEKIRGGCIELCAFLLEVNDGEQEKVDLMQVLPYIIPAMVHRIYIGNANTFWEYDEKMQVFVKDPVQHEEHQRGRIVGKDDLLFRGKNLTSRKLEGEVSEEIRLLMCKLIHALLEHIFERKAASLLHPYFYDLMLLLVAYGTDPYPALNIQSCITIQLLTLNMVPAVKHFAVGLVRAYKPLLMHRHAKVRLNGLLAIETLVACPNIDKCKGAGTEAIADLLGHVDENVIPIAAFYRHEVTVNAFAKLDQDNNANVREAFYRMIGKWLLELPDRYDHESRLLPYLVSSLNDDIPSIAENTMQLMNKLGDRHEQENAQDIIEKRQYGIDGDPRCNYEAEYPHPFQGRPKLGARLYIRAKCRRFVNVLLKELNNWMESTRLHAAKLLKCVLVYSEEQITMDIHLIMQALLKGSKDANVQHELNRIANLVGRFIYPEVYLPFLLPRLSVDNIDVDLTSKICTLQVLTNMIRGSKSKELYPHLKELINQLSTLEMMQDKMMRPYIARLLMYLLELLHVGNDGTIAAHYRQTGRLVTISLLYEKLVIAFIALAHLLDENNANEVFQKLTELSVEESKESLILTYGASTFSTCMQIFNTSKLDYVSEPIEINYVKYFIQHAPREYLSLVKTTMQTLEKSIDGECTPEQDEHSTVFENLKSELKARLA